MRRQVNVLEAQEFAGKGKFFYCTSNDMQSKSQDEILDWFGKVNKITLGDEHANEFPVISIAPMISFTDNVAVMVNVETKELPSGVFPTTAMIE